MGKYKKIGLGLSLLLTLAVGFFIFTPKSYAAGIVGFSYKEINDASGNNNNFHFTDASAKTIEGTIKHNGVAKTVTFTLENPNQQVTWNSRSITYIYADDGDFCKPDLNKLNSSDRSRGGRSEISVDITGTDTSNPVGTITYEIKPSAGSTVGVWPGTADGGITCGQPESPNNPNNTNVMSARITQSKITVKPANNPTGPGSGFTKASLQAAKFTFVKGDLMNADEISMTGVAGEKEVDFFDNHPYDKGSPGDTHADQWKYTSTDSTSVFCPTGKVSGEIFLTPTTTFDSDTITASLSIPHWEKQSDGTWSCKTTPIPNIEIANPAPANEKLSDGTIAHYAEEFAVWDVDGSGNAVIQLYDCNYHDGTCGGSKKTLVFNKDGLYVSDPQSNCHGWNLTLDSGKENMGKLFDNGQTTCTTNKELTQRVAAILGKKGQNAPTPDTGTGTATNTVGTEGQCDKSLPSFGWLFCPMLEAIDGVFSSVDSSIQGQLNFNVNQNLSDTKDHDQVRKAWAAMKDISSIFLVIIMLVMVLSQAFGGGPFDAYTVKKLMPKLVVAVIFAQISWPILKFIIGVGNDAGSGLADIMFYPFGGQGTMQLQNLVGGLGDGAPAAVVGGSFFAGILVTILNPFGILILALAVVMAVFTAIATLLVRTMLIIGLVIFAPLALLAWILPGTNKYWKMWYDNFSKMLIMFPLIMGLIAVGRIFAWVTTNSGTGKGILAMFAVLIGYFGPYFFLPKTFKWGGSLLSMANQGISKASDKIKEKPKAILQERQKELAHQKETSAARRLRDWRLGNLGAWGKFNSAIRGDKLRSGEWDPTYRLPVSRAELARQRREKETKIRAQAVRSDNEEREFATQAISELASYKNPGNEDDFFREVIQNASGEYSHSDIEAALDLMADRGGNPNFRFLQDWMDREYERGGEHRIIAGQFASRKADKLFPKLPNSPYYKNDEGWAAGVKAGDFATVSEAGLERALDELQQRATDASLTVAQRNSAQDALNNLYTEFNTAITNPNISPSIGPGMRRIIETSLAGRQADADNFRPAVTQTAAQTSSAPMAVQVRAALAAQAAGSGGGASPTVAIDPSTIRINHEQNYQINLPSGTALGAATTRTAFKSQILADSGTAQTFAHALAYNVDMASRPTHDALLSEMANEARRSGSPDRIASFNGVIDQIQQAYTQRINDAVAHVRDSGGDAAAQAAEAQRQRSLVSGQMAAYERMRL